LRSQQTKKGNGRKIGKKIRKTKLSGGKGGAAARFGAESKAETFVGLIEWRNIFHVRGGNTHNKIPERKTAWKGDIGLDRCPEGYKIISV